MVGIKRKSTAEPLDLPVDLASRIGMPAAFERPAVAAPETVRRVDGPIEAPRSGRPLLIGPNEPLPVVAPVAAPVPVLAPAVVLEPAPEGPAMVYAPLAATTREAPAAGVLNPDDLPASLLARFRDYAWPGNVRELRNAVSRFLALGELDGPIAKSSASPPTDASTDESTADPIGRLIDAGVPYSRARKRLLEEFERRYVDALLAKHDGNIARAAEEAGIARRYFALIHARKSK